MTTNAKTFGIDLNYFFEKGAHIAIARKIVFNIANKPVKLVTSADGVQVPVYALSSDACQKIVEGYYQDTIFEDIYQSIALELINLNGEGLLDVSYSSDGEGEAFWDDLKGDYRTTKKLDTRCLDDEEKYLNFLDEIQIDQNGEEKRVNSFLRLYKAVRACLGEYSLNNSQKSQLYIYDLMYTDDNGKDHTLSNKSSSYMWEASKQADASLDDYIQRSDIKSFLRYCKKVQTAKMFSRTCEVISDLIVGMSYNEISQDLEISVDAVKKTVQRVRDTWKNGFKVRLEKKNYRSIYKPILSGTITNYRGTSNSGSSWIEGQGNWITSSYNQLKKADIIQVKTTGEIDTAIDDLIKKMRRHGLQVSDRHEKPIKTFSEIIKEKKHQAYIDTFERPRKNIYLKDFDLTTIEYI